MATLRDIRRRISSVESTIQVTRTMEMVSTAKIRKAQNRIEHARPYANALAEMLNEVATSSRKIKHPLLAVRRNEKVVVAICMASDRGLAGGFNINIIHLTEEYIREKTEQGIEVRLITIGRKITDYFTEIGIEPIMSFVGNSGEPSYEDAREIANLVIPQYSDAQIDEVALIYNRFINVAVQRPEVGVLLPVNAEDIVGEEIDELDDVEEPYKKYIFEPSAKQVLQTLLPKYVEVLLFQAILESAASEHGARRVAMKAASDNASNMIVTLTRSYNRARQAAITTEISEIVGGAEALKG
ncbi:MAG: ATP synthase F1 subunit gamma [Coriobacteriia bacterium]|nr:ATP synthase F1 subunit gamma [Coriobacteriia bacterium]